MAKQARSKRQPPSRRGKGPTTTSWKPGQSGNPRGRPRSGLAFAERVRERVDPDLVIDLAMRVAEDEELSPAARLNALWPLIDRGFIKPPTTLAATVSAAVEPTFDVTALPLDEQRNLLDLIRRARAALPEGES